MTKKSKDPSLAIAVMRDVLLQEIINLLRQESGLRQIFLENKRQKASNRQRTAASRSQLPSESAMGYNITTAPATSTREILLPGSGDLPTTAKMAQKGFSNLALNEAQKQVLRNFFKNPMIFKASLKRIEEMTATLKTKLAPDSAEGKRADTNATPTPSGSQQSGLFKMSTASEVANTDDAKLQLDLAQFITKLTKEFRSLAKGFNFFRDLKLKTTTKDGHAAATIKIKPLGELHKKTLAKLAEKLNMVADYLENSTASLKDRCSAFVKAMSILSANRIKQLDQRNGLHSLGMVDYLRQYGSEVFSSDHTMDGPSGSKAAAAAVVKKATDRGADMGLAAASMGVFHELPLLTARPQPKPSNNGQQLEFAATSSSVNHFLEYPPGDCVVGGSSLEDVRAVEPGDGDSSDDDDDDQQLKQPPSLSSVPSLFPTTVPDGIKAPHVSGAGERSNTQPHRNLFGERPSSPPPGVEEAISYSPTASPTASPR